MSISSPRTSPFAQPALALPAQLPLLTSPLIDRHTEFALVCSLLRQEHVSLVTLTGPGGVGKTRLAIQVAREVRNAFSDGVAFVSLETLTDSADIIPTIARACGIPEIDGRSLRESLIQFLSRKQFLLVLDNAEQLISSAPLATHMLALAPRLKILVTSREGLRVRGEQIVSLAPLQLPSMERRPGPQELLSPTALLAHYLGRAARVQGDLEQAHANYEQSLALYRQIGDTLGVAVLLNALGSVAAAQGDDAMAQELFAQSVPLVRTTGDRYDLANVQVEVGLTMVRRGDIARGQDLLLQGLRLWRDIGPRTGIVMALSGLAEVATATGQSERAGRLFGAARLLYSPESRLLSDHATIDLEQSIARAREQLDGEAFSSGWSTGQSMSEEQAIADALE